MELQSDLFEAEREERELKERGSFEAYSSLIEEGFLKIARELEGMKEGLKEIAKGRRAENIESVLLNFNNVDFSNLQEKLTRAYY